MIGYNFSKSIDDDMRHGIHDKRAYEKFRILSKTKPRNRSLIEDSKGIPLAKDSMILKNMIIILQ